MPIILDTYLTFLTPITPLVSRSWCNAREQPSQRLGRKAKVLGGRTYTSLSLRLLASLATKLVGKAASRGIEDLNCLCRFGFSWRVKPAPARLHTKRAEIGDGCSWPFLCLAGRFFVPRRPGFAFSLLFLFSVYLVFS